MSLNRILLKSEIRMWDLAVHESSWREMVDDLSGVQTPINIRVCFSTGLPTRSVCQCINETISRIFTFNQMGTAVSSIAW